MATQIQLRRGTTAEWATTNPVLAQGEVGIDLTLGEIRLGDGITAWAALAVIGAVDPADINSAVAAYLIANPVPAPDLSGYALVDHDHDGDYDPAGTAASLVAGLTIPDSPDDIGAQPAGSYVPTTRTVAGKALSANITLTPADVGAAPALGADDNYVTDAEKVKLANLSGTNTGDQTLAELGGAPASGQAAVNALTAAASVTVPATHSMHTLTMTTDTTLVFANPTAGHAFTLKLSGAFTPTFPASVVWAGGSAPTYASGKVYVFASFDAGTSWAGSAL